MIKKGDQNSFEHSQFLDEKNEKDFWLKYLEENDDTIWKKLEYSTSYCVQPHLVNNNNSINKQQNSSKRQDMSSNVARALSGSSNNVDAGITNQLEISCDTLNNFTNNDSYYDQVSLQNFEDGSQSQKTNSAQQSQPTCCQTCLWNAHIAHAGLFLQYSNIDAVISSGFGLCCGERGDGDASGRAVSAGNLLSDHFHGGECRDGTGFGCKEAICIDNVSGTNINFLNFVRNSQLVPSRAPCDRSAAPPPLFVVINDVFQLMDELVGKVKSYVSPVRDATSLLLGPFQRDIFEGMLQAAEVILASTGGGDQKRMLNLGSNQSSLLQIIHDIQHERVKTDPLLRAKFEGMEQDEKEYNKAPMRLTGVDYDGCRCAGDSSNDFHDGKINTARKQINEEIVAVYNQKESPSPVSFALLLSLRIRAVTVPLAADTAAVRYLATWMASLGLFEHAARQVIGLNTAENKSFCIHSADSTSAGFVESSLIEDLQLYSPTASPLPSSGSSLPFISKPNKSSYSATPPSAARLVLAIEMNEPFIIKNITENFGGVIIDTSDLFSCDGSVQTQRLSEIALQLASHEEGLPPLFFKINRRQFDKAKGNLDDDARRAAKKHKEGYEICEYISVFSPTQLLCKKGSSLAVEDILEACGTRQDCTQDALGGSNVKEGGEAKERFLNEKKSQDSLGELNCALNNAFNNLVFKENKKNCKSGGQKNVVNNNVSVLNFSNFPVLVNFACCDLFVFEEYWQKRCQGDSEVPKSSNANFSDSIVNSLIDEYLYYFNILFPECKLIFGHNQPAAVQYEGKNKDKNTVNNNNIDVDCTRNRNEEICDIHATTENDLPYIVLNFDRGAFEAMHPTLRPRYACATREIVENTAVNFNRKYYNNKIRNANDKEKGHLISSLPTCITILETVFYPKSERSKGPPFHINFNSIAPLALIDRSAGMIPQNKMWNNNNTYNSNSLCFIVKNNTNNKIILKNNLIFLLDDVFKNSCVAEGDQGTFKSASWTRKEQLETGYYFYPCVLNNKKENNNDKKNKLESVFGENINDNLKFDEHADNDNDSITNKEKPSRYCEASSKIGWALFPVSENAFEWISKVLTENEQEPECLLSKLYNDDRTVVRWVLLNNIKI